MDHETGSQKDVRHWVWAACHCAVLLPLSAESIALLFRVAQPFSLDSPFRIHLVPAWTRIVVGAGLAMGLPCKRFPPKDEKRSHCDFAQLGDRLPDADVLVSVFAHALDGPRHTRLGIVVDVYGLSLGDSTHRCFVVEPCGCQIGCAAFSARLSSCHSERSRGVKDFVCHPGDQLPSMFRSLEWRPSLPLLKAISS